MTQKIRRGRKLSQSLSRCDPMVPHFCALRLRPARAVSRTRTRDRRENELINIHFSRAFDRRVRTKASRFIVTDRHFPSIERGRANLFGGEFSGQSTSEIGGKRRRRNSYCAQSEVMWADKEEVMFFSSSSSSSILPLLSNLAKMRSGGFIIIGGLSGK